MAVTDIPLSDLVPKAGEAVDWRLVEASPIGGAILKLAEVPQPKDFHAEGDVLTHTRLVTEQIVADGEYAEADGQDRLILFLGALLHDIGKLRTTREEFGRITSPHHSGVGAVMARELLWSIGFCGDDVKRNIRESVCSLIKYHSFPPFIIHDNKPEQRLTAAAAMGELAPGFSLRKLICLERADINGRKSFDTEDALCRVEYCAELAKELGILDTPYPFSSNYAMRAYFKGRTRLPSQDIYPDSFGTVILMSGLPGTGKDTWIRSNCPDMPVISLDAIRERMGVKPTDNQGTVVAEGHAEARRYLRRGIPFVWNATSITEEQRSKQICLFEQYGASVRTVFLETSLDEELRRNSSREREVPPEVIRRMLSKLQLPERKESELVEWYTV